MAAPGAGGAGGAQPQGQPGDVDPLSKFKMLIPRLKESLANLMKVAAQVFHANAHVDNCVKPSEGAPPLRFDRSLEEFYAICDQLELNLRIALECATQNAETHKHTPIPVQGLMPKPPPQVEGQPPPPPPPEQQPYTQYLSTIRTQVTCAKEVHDALLECARKVSERPNPLQQQPPPQQQPALPSQQQLQQQQQQLTPAS